MSESRNAVLVVKSRSRIIWQNDQPWRCIVGFDSDDRPAHFEVKGRAGARAGLDLAWRTTGGAWRGQFSSRNGYVSADLSLTDIALIENTANAVRD